MKKLLKAIMLVAVLFILTGCGRAEYYIRFTDIDYIVDLLNEAPTMEELETLVDVRLRNRAERINDRNRAINQNRRENATTTTRTTGTIWTKQGLQRVDLTSTSHPPDSELNLLSMVELTNVLETTYMPNGATRNDFAPMGRIEFYFATVEGMEEERLFEITINGANHFAGIDFTQFSDIVTDSGRLIEHSEKIAEVLNTTYGMDAEVISHRTIVFYYENVQFTLQVLGVVQTGFSFRVEATLLQ